MKHLTQPDNYSCGPTCTAMLLSESPRKVIKLFKDLYNFKKETYISDICDILNVEYIRLRFNKRFNLALVRVHWIGTDRGHLVLYKNGYVYDPLDKRGRCSLSSYLKRIKGEGKFDFCVKLKESQFKRLWND